VRNTLNTSIDNDDDFERRDPAMQYTLAIGMPGVTEWIIIGALGLLIFGKRLPEVGKSLGKGIVEFKKGLKGIEDDVEQVDRQVERPKLVSPAPTAEPNYRFDPYTGKPVDAPQEGTAH
jgi:sec-independent protein translocase protein TatA